MSLLRFRRFVSSIDLLTALPNIMKTKGKNKISSKLTGELRFDKLILLEESSKRNQGAE